jgi:hypothetical protein
MILALTIVWAGGGAGAPGLFPHAAHVEQGFDCLDCHAPAKEAESLEVNLYPAPSQCLDCHEDSELAAWGYDEMPSPPPPHLEFSHRRHLEQELECDACHGGLTDTTLVAERSRPGHGVCGDCHDEIRGDSACETCHLNLAVLRPLDHERDFLHTHQFQARGFEDCQRCHQQAALCTRCHHGENISFLSHERTWLFTHAEESRKQMTDCRGCHDTRDFCTPCHQEEGVRPADHLDAAAWLPPGNLHASEARRDISLCASCHEEADPLCVGCHRDADNQLGTDRNLNIHPDNWRDIDWEGPWHQDDSESCFLCHDRTSRTTRVGFCTYCHSLD